MNSIPFNRPPFTGKEIGYMQQAIESAHLSGDGSFTKKCHAILEQTLGIPKALLTTSCTHALEMAALLFDIQPGDEVIIPSFTFVSTVNAFVLRGARPKFADIRPDTLNIDEQQVERLITEKTKALVVVHYAGVGCEMDDILDLARKHKMAVVEDNAHGLFGKYKGKYLGSFGSMAAQSFHETKNFSCGEGGALLINDPNYFERAEIIREKGTNRSRFFRGLVDKYSWVDMGSSYLPSDLLAAYLYAQLESWQKIQEKRKRIWEHYHSSLRDWSLANTVRQPVIPEYCDQAYHMYYLLLPSLEKRQEFIARLKEANILSVFHYLPLHLSEMGLRFGGKPGQCPHTEDLSDRLVRLPFYYSLEKADLDRVIETILSFRI